MSKIPVIHIGMPKTATKTLQWRIFAQHSEIFYLGRFDGAPFKGKYRPYRACRDETVLEIMNEIAYDNISNPDVKACRQLLDQYLLAHNPDDKLPVWSWESYSTDSRRSRQFRAKNLRQVFGDAKILMTIRHPVALLESAFLQQLRRDNIAGGYIRGKGVFYCSIDNWVTRDFLGDVSNHLDYSETVRMYIEEFGQGNVRVLAFEELLRDKEAFYQQICDFMAIDLEEAMSLVKGHVDNSRWSQIQLDKLNNIDRSPFAAMRFRFASRRTRKAMLNLAKNGEPLKFSQKARVEISQNLRKQIMERTEEGNKWLDDAFNLGLQAYGYYK